jgi:hypothetical protein
MERAAYRQPDALDLSELDPPAPRVFSSSACRRYPAPTTHNRQDLLFGIIESKMCFRRHIATPIHYYLRMLRQFAQPFVIGVQYPGPPDEGTFGFV